MSARDLSSALAAARVVVCVGPGGVGKTSTSAAIAMHGAYLGRRTIVLTIDPARRLANALGLPEIGNEERPVRADAFTAVGLPPPAGKLTAMMLDIKRTWDEVISKYHPDPHRRDRLLANRLYEALSTALAGSQEYMAMEKLFELASRKEDPLDLVVLDTPPAVHAFDFLEAPSRMLDALDNDATRWFLEPYLAKRKTRFFDAGSGFIVRNIAKFIGMELIESLAEMLAGFQGMFDGFRDRARVVRTLLEAEDTRFLVVGSPREGAVDEARAFYERLVERKVRVGGVILNRATVDPLEGAAPDLGLLERALAELGDGAELARRIHDTAALAAQAAAAEQGRAEALAELAPALPILLVPELPRDVHDLYGLSLLRRHLFLEAPERHEEPSGPHAHRADLE